MARTFTWAARLPFASAAALGPLRLIRGLEAAGISGDAWVRGPKLEGGPWEMIRRTPWTERYEIGGDDMLLPVRSRLPAGPLPRSGWQPLAEFIRVRPPASIAPGAPSSRAPVELRPAAAFQEPTVLVADTDAWLQYASAAPEIRLERLAFAADAAQPERVIIRGEPLPPLPGMRFVEREAVLTPAGFEWRPAVSPATLRAAFGLEDAESAILWPDGGWTRIPRSAWIGARRAAVRFTLNPEAYAG